MSTITHFHFIIPQWCLIYLENWCSLFLHIKLVDMLCILFIWRVFSEEKISFFFLFGIIWNCPNKWTVLKTYLASWWYDPWCNIWPKYINIYIYTYIHIYRLLTTTNEWFMAFSASHFALTNFWHKDFLITSWTLSICDAIHTDLHDWYYFKSK